jgi:hypothetical protein
MDTTVTRGAPDSPLADSPPRTRYIPAADWNKYHPWPPAGGLRHLIFHADKNGFRKCFRKIGSRVLIDESAFFAWVDEHGASAETEAA